MPGGNLELARQAAANLQALVGLLDEEVVLIDIFTPIREEFLAP